MSFPNLWLRLALIVLSHGAFTIAQDFNCYQCEGNGTKAFNRNLNKLFSIFTSNTEIGNGFFNLSVGQEPDKVYSIAVCREDLLQADCHSCLTNAANKFRMVCLTGNESIGFYGTSCMLRYSYRPISGLRMNTPNCTYKSSWPIHEPYVEKFRQKTATLLSKLVKKAAAGDSRYKYGAQAVDVATSLKVYALTLCSPDLSASDCFACLQSAISSLQLYNNFLKGAQVYLPSCTVQFENYLFFNMVSGISMPPVPSPFNTSLVRHSRRKSGWYIYIIVGIVFALLITVCLFSYFSRRKRENKEVEIENNDQIRCVDFMQFDFSVIQAATCNFSDAKILGKGSSAKVYKGVLPGGQEIAVKRLIKIVRDVELNFNNEVLLLTNLQHRNLVKLLGFCVDHDSRLLIYEFLPNESLDWFLHAARRANLNWEIRYNIIQAIAGGISYLHDDSQLRVIHRDLKPSNILLDADMKPKISNFSKATHVHEDQTRGATSTIKGTYGYMPPEFVQQGIFSVKSDVFSFGVVLLEIICGQMINDFSKGENDEDLLIYVWRKQYDGTALDVVDTTLQKTEDHKAQVLRIIKIALLCVQENPTQRPTMAVVRYMLNNDSTVIKEPSKPAHVIFGHMSLLSAHFKVQK